MGSDWTPAASPAPHRHDAVGWHAPVSAAAAAKARALAPEAEFHRLSDLHAASHDFPRHFAGGAPRDAEQLLADNSGFAGG